MLEFVASTEVYYEQFRNNFLSGNIIGTLTDRSTNQCKAQNSSNKENFNYYQDQHDKLKAKKLSLIQYQRSCKMKFAVWKVNEQNCKFLLTTMNHQTLEIKIL